MFPGNFIRHLIMDVIMNPCWDYTEFMLVKGALGKRLSSAMGLILGNIY